MKKLLSLIITTVIILALPAFSVSAAYNAELTVSSTEAKSGENAEIVISIANNPGLCALGFEIQYDKDALTVVSAKFADLFSSASSRVNTQDGKIVFNAASADNVNGNGAVAKITFKAPGSAAGPPRSSASSCSRGAKRRPRRAAAWRACSAAPSPRTAPTPRCTRPCSAPAARRAPWTSSAPPEESA